MKEKLNRAAEESGITPEQVNHKIEDNTAELLKKARKTEILEEVKEKLGIRTDRTENLLQKAGQVLNQAKDHVEVRTEQWVKEVGIRKDKLMNDLGERTNHLLDKVKKSEPVKKLKEKAGELKKHARHTMKMSAHKVAVKN